MGRIWAYLKALIKGKADQMMDPEVEIQAAIDEARTRDQELRNQAANVIAHRTTLEARLEDMAEEVGEARELAKQALVKADEATAAGDAAATTKWNQTAQAMALKLQAAENNMASLREQFTTAATQADAARDAVQRNAMRVQELAAKRMELLGQLEAAKMQESVNGAVAAMSATVGEEGPSLERVEQKIDERLARAQARAELHEATPEGAEAELRESVSLAQADVRLAELRKELGMGAAPAGELPPGS